MRGVVALVFLALSCAPPREPSTPNESDDVPSVIAPIAPVAAASAPRVQGPFYVPEPTGRPTAILRPDAPNIRYAALDQATCERELSARAIAFVRGEPTAGVLAPVRLRGPLHGVAIHSTLPPAAREHAPIELFDCRLLLALDDFSALVSQRGVAEMTHLSVYRPRAAFGCTPKYAGMQHCAALAIDIATFKLRDGSTWSVERDFAGKVGLPTCPRASALSASSAALWSLVCDTAERAIFHVMLTPNFNAQHFNHFHLEITPNAGWMLIH